MTSHKFNQQIEIVMDIERKIRRKYNSKILNIWFWDKKSETLRVYKGNWKIILKKRNIIKCVNVYSSIIEWTLLIIIIQYSPRCSL